MDANNERQQNSQNSNEKAQQRDDNPLGISNEDIQKVLQVKCRKHTKRNAEFLHLIPDVENARICNMCIKQDNIPHTNYQDIREIFMKQSESDLLNYPVFTDSELGEIIENIDENMNDETNQMDVFFRELTAYIEVKINERKEARKLKLRIYGEIYQRYQVCWSEIIDIENLRRILLEKENEEKLAQFVRNHVSNAERNTQRIKEFCDQFKGIKDEFSMEQPNKIRNLVCSLIQEIDFFDGSNRSPLQTIEQSDEYRNLLQIKQRELDYYKDQIKTFQQKLQEQQLHFEEMQMLKEKKSQEIIKQIKQENTDLKQNTSDQKLEISNLKQENLNVKKENLDLQQSINDQKQEIEIIKQDNSNLKVIKSDQEQTISDLRQEILKLNQDYFDLEQKLTDKKQEIEIIRQDNSNLKQNISDQQQEIQIITEENSSLWQNISKLKQEIFNLKQESYDIMAENSALREQLKVQSLKPTDLLPRTQLILGNYQNSQRLSVTKNNQEQLQFKNDTQDNLYGFSQLDFILDPSTNYVVHVQMEQIQGEDKYFFFGLLPDIDEAATEIPEGRIRYSEYTEGGGDINTYLKGNNIRTDKDSLERKTLEVRINIEKQILKVGSLPNYESVVQIDDPNRIEPSTPYRFYLFGLRKQTKMIITRLETVNQFNNFM